MTLFSILERLALAVTDVESEPELLDQFFAPIVWVGSVIILMNVVAVARKTDDRLRRVIVSVSWIYAGLSLVVIAVCCTRVFCTYVSDVTPKHLEKLRIRQLVWLCEVGLEWGIGGALIGVTALFRALLPWKTGAESGPQAHRLGTSQLTPKLDES